ncbi:hypothetical protein Hanom_Chr14g01250331 [Helianthus anomalus]
MSVVNSLILTADSDMDLKFISTNNQAGYLATPPEKHMRLYT